MSANKLRKPSAMSATMALASSTYSTPAVYINANVQNRENVTTTASGMQPMTAREQYWATRALRAEALLAAQESHKKEVKTLEHVQEMKLQRELATLTKEHKEKQAMLERFLTALVILAAILVVVIIYLATHYARHSIQIQYKQQERWWSAIGASHFTIPILSPFTSVVEHETSVVGSKVIAMIAGVAACLAYFVFRHWLSSGTKKTPASMTGTISSAVNTMLPSIDR